MASRDSKLNEVEKGLLFQLSQDERWNSILEKMRLPSPLEYKPGGSDTEEVKSNRWIYESGRSRENGELISILKLQDGV